MKKTRCETTVYYKYPAGGDAPFAAFIKEPCKKSQPTPRCIQCARLSWLIYIPNHIPEEQSYRYLEEKIKREAYRI